MRIEDNYPTGYVYPSTRLGSDEASSTQEVPDARSGPTLPSDRQPDGRAARGAGSVEGAASLGWHALKRGDEGYGEQPAPSFAVGDVVSIDGIDYTVVQVLPERHLELVRGRRT